MIRATFLPRLCGVVSAAVLLATAGCGPTAAPAMGDYIDVTGTVKLADGKPFKGTIHFQPESTSAGRDTFASVTDGAFKTKLFVAKYRVAFDIEEKKPNAPAKYTKFESSGQTADVKSGMTPLSYELK